MKIPSLPTDNLYKFMAIFGLVLISLSIYIFNSRMMSVEKKTILTNAKFKYDSIVQNYKEEVYEELGEKGKYKSLIDSIIDKEFDDFNDVKLDKSIVALAELDLLKTRYLRITIILSALGSGLMFLGFKLWYSKHQKYIDAEREWKGEIFVELLKEKKLKDEKMKAKDEVVKAESTDNNEEQD